MKNSFADLISLGIASVIIGIAALAYAVSKPYVSFLLGALGIIFGILSLRIPKQEKLERWSSWLGIVLSVISVIWGLVNIYVQ
ncbi:MAG TPA: hypothetical protein VFR47_26180 [Anaerolineales bacterium]|nr:hypothetical protein [Anaerolineales bacterium]